MGGCRQIFVIGAHRSGTTWLANCLAKVEGVYTPSMDLHHGQIESAYFSRFLPYFNGAQRYSDKLAMFHSFERTDFFMALDLSEPPPGHDSDPYTYFSVLMDNAARSNACDYWVEKSPGNVLIVDQLINHFPSAKFVFINRNYFDQSLSYALGLLGGVNLWNLLRAGFVAGVYRSCMKLDHDNIYEIEYEALQKDFDENFTRCLSFLELGYREFALSNFKPNSSYSEAYSDVRKKPALTFLQRSIVSAGYFVANLVPRSMLTFLIRLRKKIIRTALPDWVYASSKG